MLLQSTYKINGLAYNLSAGVDMPQKSTLGHRVSHCNSPCKHQRPSHVESSALHYNFMCIKL